MCALTSRQVGVKLEHPVWQPGVALWWPWYQHLVKADGQEAAAGCPRVRK